MFEEFAHPLLPYTVSVSNRGDILRNYPTISEQGTPADLLLAEVCRELQELKAFQVEAKAMLGASEMSAAVVDTEVATSKTVNINTATQLDIESLPFIGRAIASKILKLREESPFSSTENLIRRTGLKVPDLEAFERQVSYD